MTLLCDVLSREINDGNSWDKVRSYLAGSRGPVPEVTAYDLYLALTQDKAPAPLSILDLLLEKNPSLVEDEDTYQMTVMLAYCNPLTPFATIKYLLIASMNPFQLANSLLRRSFRSNFICFDAARSLIQAEPNMLVTFDEDGNLPIHDCCIHGESPTMLQLILDEGVARFGIWMPRNEDGMSPIDLLLDSNNEEYAHHALGIFLHSSPHFPTREEAEEHGLLHAAARISDVFYARQLLEAYPHILDYKNGQFGLPLHVACLHGTTTMIEFLLQKEIKLKKNSPASAAHDIRCYTPSQLACLNRNTTPKVMQMLLDSHPDHTSAPALIWKYKLLHISAMGSNTEVARFLIDVFPQAISISSDTGNLPIRVACCSGSAEMIELLFEEGLYHFDSFSGMLHSETLHNESNLQLACSNSNVTSAVISRLLHNTGTSADQCLQQKLLHRATKAGNSEVSKVILQKFPMALYDMDEASDIPLHAACESGCTRTISYILRKNNSSFHRAEPILTPSWYHGIYQKNKKGVTPWDLLCKLFANNIYEGETISVDIWSCVKVVLYAEAKSMAREQSNVPILHAAIRMVRPLDVLCSIIISGMIQHHPTVVDNRNRTALHVAVEMQSFHGGDWKDIIECLLDRESSGGECAVMRDSDHRLPLHTGAAFGLKWTQGLRSILECNFNALVQRDKKSGGLYPFMLAAASKEHSDLNTIFELLRLNPTMIESGMSK